MSRRVVCRAYGSGIFHGVTFHEEVVDGRFVGVAEVSDPDVVAWFEGRDGFLVEPQEAREAPAESAPDPEPKKATRKRKKRS